MALPTSAQDVLPYPPQPFKGKIGRTAKDSTPDFPKAVTAPKGAPNVLLILTDDVAFGSVHLRRRDPHADLRQARQGRSALQHVSHHGAVLAHARGPHHRAQPPHNATGVITEMGTGFPGYNSLMPKSSGTVGEILKQNGYNTAWFGKNHNVPDWQSSQAGPFDLWPTALGFEYFYGFIGGDTDQWHPALFDGTKPDRDADARPEVPLRRGPGRPRHRVDPAAALARAGQAVLRLLRAGPDPRAAPRAQGMDRQVQGPVRPGLGQAARGDARPPDQAGRRPCRHQADASAQGNSVVGFAQRRREEALRPHDGGLCRVPGLRRLQHRAGHRGRRGHRRTGQHADHLRYGRQRRERRRHAAGPGQRGRRRRQRRCGDLPYLLSIMDELGGPPTYNHYPVGWAHAMDTPFQWTKQVASHFGGTRNGLVISWPKRIKQTGEVRSQFSSVIDIVPTILEAAGVKEPTMINGVKQTPIEGLQHGLYLRRRQGPHAAQDAVLRAARQPRHLHDGWMANTDAAAAALGKPPPAAGQPARMTSNGSSTTSRRTSRSRTTSPRRTPPSSRSCRRPSTRRRRNTTSIRSMPRSPSAWTCAFVRA